MRRGFLFAIGVVIVACVSDTIPIGDGGGPCEDPTFCDDKCGVGLADACGQARTCADCGAGRTCDGTTHKCSCAELPGVCDNRCGKITTNCNVSKDCGGCDGGACPSTGNCSGCTPDDVTACSGKNCGTAKNNCNQQIACGPLAGACPSPQLCSTSGKCCDPQSKVCFAKCGTVVAACGSSFDCGLCLKTFACKSNACACDCSTLVPSAPMCEAGGCACSGHNTNTDTNNCGCQNVKCPTTWSCVAGVCKP